MTKTTTPHVIVVGAGLAGLSCAISCADGGARVTVLESKPRVGGATWSFERHGLSFDNGQHVFLRCCAAYRRFLERIGTTSLAPLQDRLSLPVISPTGDAPKTAWIKSAKLPAPLHLLPSLFTYSFLSVTDRMRLGAAVRALQSLRLDDPANDEISFAQFLEQHGQRHGAIEALWDLIVLPTVNLHCDQASLLLAAKVFKTGLLEDSSAADIGWSRVPLSQLHGSPAVNVIEQAGGIVRTGAKVSAIDMTTVRGASVPQATGVTVDGEHLDADVVVLAVPHEQAGELLPSGGTFDPTTFAGLGRSPIIDVHVVYDRKVMSFDVATGLNTPVQYVFDRTDAAGLNGEGQCLAVSVSNADDEHGERPEVLIDRYTKALAELFPAARKAKVIDAVVSREHAATFRGVPGTHRLRPHTATGFDKLFLAGAWLDTGWPATMEGAVRSGIAASSSALGEFSYNTGTYSLEEALA